MFPSPPSDEQLGANNLFTPLRCIQGNASDDGLRQSELSYNSRASRDFGQSQLWVANGLEMQYIQ